MTQWLARVQLQCLLPPIDDLPLTQAFAGTFHTPILILPSCAFQSCWNTSLLLLCIMLTSASVFKIKLNVFLDTLIQRISLQRMKINNFRGDLTDVLDEKEALMLIV